MQSIDKHLDLQTEINLAVSALGADKIDIEKLLVPIVDKNVSPQQIPALLEQAYERLCTLRTNLIEFEQLTKTDIEISGFVDQLRSAIKPDDGFSLSIASNTLNALSNQCEKRIAAEERAMIHSMLALLAAMEQDYHKAEQHFNTAATTATLPTDIQWQYQIYRAQTLADFGREFGQSQALQQSIALLENTVLKLVSAEQHPQKWAKTQHILGNVCGVVGQRQSGTRNLENAITAFKASLSVQDRKQHPAQWAETQNNLGNALGILAHRQNDENMLSQSIQAFEKSLEERAREVSQQDWATTNNNLAAVLQSLGQRNKDAKMLKRSTEVYKHVLQVWTKEQQPLNWAATMNNLGTALRLLGEYRKGQRTLEQSVAAYNSALSERNREKFPQEWAMTQNNLGAALQKLAEREENTHTLLKAISAYENALQEWTRERAPMAWTMTMANLGVARRTLAAASESLEHAHQSVNELEMVCNAFRQASHAQYSEFSIEELAKAQKLVKTLELNQGKYAALVKH